MSASFNAQQAMDGINANKANACIREFLINGTTHVAIKNGDGIVVVDASKNPEVLFEDRPSYIYWKSKTS